MNWKTVVLLLLAGLAIGLGLGSWGKEAPPAKGPWTEYQAAPLAMPETQVSVTQQGATTQDAQVQMLHQIQQTQSTMQAQARMAAYQAQQQAAESQLRMQRQADDAAYAARSQARIEGR